MGIFQCYWYIEIAKEMYIRKLKLTKSKLIFTESKPIFTRSKPIFTRSKPF